MVVHSDSKEKAANASSVHSRASSSAPYSTGGSIVNWSQESQPSQPGSGTPVIRHNYKKAKTLGTVLVDATPERSFSSLLLPSQPTFQQWEQFTLRGLRKLFRDPVVQFKSQEQKLLMIHILSCTADVFGVLPTSGGKSALWQVIAFLQPECGFVVVVPFVLPNADQVESNNQKGISTWKYKSNEECPPGTQSVLCQHEQYVMKKFQMYVSFSLMVCSYIYLRFSITASYPARAPVWKRFFNLAPTSTLQCILLTGTFPPPLKKQYLSLTICEKYTLIIRAPTNRPELGYHVVDINPKATISENTVALITQLENGLRDDECIIVFFQSGDDCDDFGTVYHCAIYHSKLPEAGLFSKESHLSSWDSGQHKVLAATTATAVGIDQPYIKFTVVVESTYGLVTYAQEIG